VLETARHAIRSVFSAYGRGRLATVHSGAYFFLRSENNLQLLAAQRLQIVASIESQARQRRSASHVFNRERILACIRSYYCSPQNTVAKSGCPNSEGLSPGYGEAEPVDINGRFRDEE